MSDAVADPLALKPPTATAARSGRLGRMLVLGAVVLLATVVLRAPTFWRSVINWDESLYFLMAQEWRAGHLPYTTLWDNKPVGIYAIFAIFQDVFGGGIASMRIAAVAAAAATALFVMLIVLRLPVADRRIRWTGAGLCGAAFALASLSNDGLAANTELFMIPLTAAALLLAVSPILLQRPFVRGLSVGLLVGLAFMVKYVVVMEFPAIAFALLCLNPPASKARTGRLIAGALAGGLTPILVTLLVYAQQGQAPLWFDASIVSNLRRAAGGWAPVDMALAARFIKWAPLFAGGALLFALPWLGDRRRQRPAMAGRFDILMMLWVAGGILGLSAAKSFYSHYFIQVLPALCVATAWVWMQSRSIAGLRKVASRGLLAGLVLIVPTLSASVAVTNLVRPLIYRQDGRLALRPDSAAVIAGDILKASPSGISDVYVFDHEPIIYTLARAPLPTRYAYPAFLTTCSLERVAQIDAPAEVGRILAARPQFIVVSAESIAKLPIDPSAYARLNAILAARYAVWRRYDGALVYRQMGGVASDTPHGASATGRC